MNEIFSWAQASNSVLVCCLSCPILHLGCPRHSFSGHLTYQLYFRNYWFGACWWSLDTEESSYWITYRLMTHQMLKAKSLKWIKPQYCRKGRIYYIIKLNSVSFASLDALHWGKSKKLILNKCYHFSSTFPGKRYSREIKRQSISLGLKERH